MPSECRHIDGVFNEEKRKWKCSRCGEYFTLESDPTNWNNECLNCGLQELQWEYAAGGAAILFTCGHCSTRYVLHEVGESCRWGDAGE